MRKRFTLLLITILLCTVAAMSATRKFTLVIDAGHGGNDAGAIGAISKEKDINLRTALAFGKYVERNCPDVNVIYTRKTDVFVTLHGRAEIANKAKADLFISIHTNALPKKQIARGFETYTLGMHRAADNLDVAKRENSVILVEKDYKEHYEGFDPNSSESYIIFEFMQDRNMERSVDLAKMVQNNVCKLANRPDKGVRQAGFLVLRETSMPSCLIELGFISTPDEERFLNSETGIDNMARGIYNAFVSYKKKYDTKSSMSYKTENAKNEVASVDTPKTEKTAEKAEKAAEKTADKAVTKAEKATNKATTKAEKNAEKATAKAEKTADKAETIEPAAVVETNSKAEISDAPVFKVQICVADREMKPTDKRLKGHSEAEYYKEKGTLKYTIGSSTNYNEIYQLRKELAKDFPDAFIIAFKDGEKMNVNEAIKIFRNNKK